MKKYALVPFIVYMMSFGMFKQGTYNMHQPVLNSIPQHHFQPAAAASSMLAAAASSAVFARIAHSRALSTLDSLTQKQYTPTLVESQDDTPVYLYPLHTPEAAEYYAQLEAGQRAAQRRARAQRAARRINYEPFSGTTTAVSQSNTVFQLLPDSLADKQAKLTDFAAKFLGIPYRYGGSTPQGFDCSGFARFVFGHIGVELPRTSQAQSKTGQRVAIQNVRTGDLLFFGSRRNNGYRSTHTAIVVSNTGGVVKMIHSSRRGIVVDEIFTPDGFAYYESRFLFAKRILVPAERPANTETPDEMPEIQATATSLDSTSTSQNIRPDAH